MDGLQHSIVPDSTKASNYSWTVNSRLFSPGLAVNFLFEQAQFLSHESKSHGTSHQWEGETDVARSGGCFLAFKRLNPSRKVPLHESTLGLRCLQLCLRRIRPNCNPL